MATLLISKEGKYRAMIREVPSGIDDGYHYKVDVTGRTLTSQGRAIRNARTWLKKKRQRYYRKHPDKRVRIKARRVIPKTCIRKSPVKTIYKLYKMNKEVAKILVRMSNKTLKLHEDYSRKKWSKKVTAVSGSTTSFNTAIYTVMVDGTKRERRKVSKMLKQFTHEEYRKSNMFY